jgi:HD-GYP domain-containing protein (c-di-GMP phosphodiesterase class II)
LLLTKVSARSAEIPIGSRIFSVADTLDAITSDRPYRSAAPFDFALETIRRLSGNQLDPQVVAEFLSIREGTWPVIARNQKQISGLPKQLAGSNFNLRTGRGPI